MALFRHGVLVCEDRVRREGVRVELGVFGAWRSEVGEGGEGVGVDGGHDGEVVLEFFEVGGSRRSSSVEGVEEGGVEGAEGEFVDVVGEVEFCA